MPGNADKFDVRLTNAGNSFTGDLVLGDPQGFGSAVLGLTSDGALGAASNRRSSARASSTVSTRGAKAACALGFIQPSPPIAWCCWMAARAKAGFIDTNGHTLVVDGSIGELASGRPAQDRRRHPGAERRAGLQRPRR